MPWLPVGWGFMVQEFDKVGVVGLGTMGAGIAEVCARAGFNVIGVESEDEALRYGRERLEHSLERAVGGGKLTGEERRSTLSRVRFSTFLQDLRDADFVLEAVPERMELKREVFAELDRICSPGAILATNTSSLSVTEIAALTARPGKVVGLHFFNPAPVMKLCEVVRTVVTEPGSTSLAAEVAKRVGKTPVVVGDRAGFVANALLMPYLNHAVTLYERGVASREEIDAAATGTAAGLPMGPLALLDLIGLDVGLAVLDVLWGEFRAPRHVAAPLLRRLVAAGLTGRKSGSGFYEYTGAAAGPEESPAGPIPTAVRERRHGFDLADLLLVPHLGDAVRMVGEGYAGAEDVDTAMRFGCGYPQGPVELLRERGVERFLEAQRAISESGLLADAGPAPALVRMVHERGR